MSKVAVPVNRCVRNMSGDARLYRLNEPLNGYTYVVVSAIDERPACRVHETYIFGAQHTGEVADWGVLEGSYKGGTDHEEALRRAGYEVLS
jgi:hypothetical protein